MMFKDLNHLFSVLWTLADRTLSLDTALSTDSHVAASVLRRDRCYSNWCFTLSSWPCHHGDVLWRMMGLISS